MPPLPTIVASDLATRPPPARKWLIEGLIPSATVSLLAGDGGSGKTTVALQIAAAVAAGVPALGRHVTPGTALVLSCEDDADELHRRVAALAHSADLRPEQLAGLTLIVGADLPDGALAREAGRVELEWTGLYRALREMIEAERPTLLVLDPVSELFQADENNRRQVAAFVGELRRLAQRTGTAILLVSHPSVGGVLDRSGRSGSTAWGNAVRARLFLERVGDDPDARCLAVTKTNIGRNGQKLDLHWREGVFEVVAAPTDAERADERDRARMVFMAVLRRLTNEGRPVSPALGKNYAPTMLAREREADGIARKALEDAMADLLASGVIRVEVKGAPTRQRKRLVITEAGDRLPTAMPTALPSTYQPLPSNLPTIPLVPPPVGRHRFGLVPDRHLPPETEDEHDGFAFHC